MAEEGGIAPAPTTLPQADDVAHGSFAVSHNPPVANASRKSTISKATLDVHVSGIETPGSKMTGSRSTRRSSLELDGYFVGPRDIEKHSKLPYFMRMHGSVLPRMILPLTLVGSWSALITVISKKVVPLGVSTLLLTVLGFVVGLGLSFRSTTAYERYSDGRKAWATLAVQCRNLARCIWVHVDEGTASPEQTTDNLLSKLTAINLILAFAVALKHKLRFEPYAHYPDIASLVDHLDTFAKAAYTPEVEVVKKKSLWKIIGEDLGLSFASSNPRKSIKRASKPLGNLPLEILTYLSAYAEEVSTNGTLKSPIIYGQIMTYLAGLTDTLSAAERVLATPLPIGYNILISQIVLLYVYLLPFQLYSALGWITIPGTVAAAYIILGLAAIGNELENPFGNDVNDLPLDMYCAELGKELDGLTSVKMGRWSDVVRGKGLGIGGSGSGEGEGGVNRVLWPLSAVGVDEWKRRGEEGIREALRAKVIVASNGDVTRTASATGSTKLGGLRSETIASTWT